MATRKQVVGAIVSGLLLFITSIYQDETKMFLNSLLAQVSPIPPSDVGYVLVLAVFLMAFAYFGGLSLYDLYKWIRKRHIPKGTTETISVVRFEKPEYNSNSFDESFKQLEQATPYPKTKAIMLGDFRPHLYRLCHSTPWSEEVRDRIEKVLEYIPKFFSDDDSNINWYLQYISTIISGHSKHTISMVKEKFLVELENKFNDPKFETYNLAIFNILQKLHEYSEDYITKLIEDAGYQWSDQRFETLEVHIGFWELDNEARKRVSQYLVQKMEDTEKDEKAYKRFKELYEIAKGTC